MSYEHLREQLRPKHARVRAVELIAAAVVGVVLNLAVFFTRHALFPNARPDWFGIGVAAAAFIALLRLHWGMPAVIGSAAALGFLWKTI